MQGRAAGGREGGVALQTERVEAAGVGTHNRGRVVDARLAGKLSSAGEDGAGEQLLGSIVVVAGANEVVRQTVRRTRHKDAGQVCDPLDDEKDSGLLSPPDVG